MESLATPRMLLLLTLQKLMRSCSSELRAKISKPKMSSTPAFDDGREGYEWTMGGEEMRGRRSYCSGQRGVPPKCPHPHSPTMPSPTAAALGAGVAGSTSGGAGGVAAPESAAATSPLDRDTLTRCDVSNKGRRASRETRARTHGFFHPLPDHACQGCMLLLHHHAPRRASRTCARRAPWRARGAHPTPWRARAVSAWPGRARPGRAR